MKIFPNKGITVVELLIVLSIMALLIAIALPRFSDMRNIETLKSATEDVLSVIDKARSQTLASVDSSEYGVHFETNNVIIFKGTTYSAGATDNEVISIFSPATITNISLTGGVSDVYFNRLTGDPSATGSVTVSNGSSTKIITISATGIASVN